MNFDELTRNELIVIRRKSDESLLFFTKFWFRVLHGSKFIVNWHHEEICKELDKIENYELELLNINIPPRHSKTELAAVNKIARGIGMNPQSNWLYITASDELRSQTSVSIRDIVSHPYFKIMYGIELKKDQNAKNLWRTTQGGGLKTATIFGQITGFGAGQMIDHDLEDTIRNFEGAIVLDDINKTDDSEVENAISEKVTRTLFNTIFSRKNSKDTPIINIQQRVGTSDATAKLMEFYGEDNPKAKFMVYPVLIDGKPLWEFKHTLQDIYALRDGMNTQHVFLTQYMQDPRNIQGLLCPIEALSFTNFPDVHSGSYCFIDPADKGGDKLSAVFVKIYIEEKKIIPYVHDVVHTNMGIEAASPIIHEKILLHEVEECYIESNGIGLALVLQLKGLIENKKILKPTHSSDPKEIRILRNYEFINSSFAFSSSYKEKHEFTHYVKDLTTFKREGQNTHKADAMDVTCYAAEVLKIKYRKIIFS